MVTREQLTTFLDFTDADPWVQGGPPVETITLVDPDPSWPAAYDRLAAAVRETLGDRVLALEHVGSTAVPDFAAKDVVDLDLTVADPGDEDAYLPALDATGWEHLLFRDWLRAHPEDRRAYEAAKRDALGPGTVDDYNARKQAVVREIYARVFAALD